MRDKNLRIKKSDEKNCILIYNTPDGHNRWVYLWEYGRKFSTVMDYRFDVSLAIPYSVKTSSLFYMGRNYG